MAERVRRLRGLPYEANLSDIKAWLRGFPVVENGIDIQVNANGCPMGQAWVEFETEEAARSAQTTLHKQYMGQRYIEVLPASASDLIEREKQRAVLAQPRPAAVIKLRGLPWAAERVQILRFLDARSLPLSAVTIVKNARGRPSGEAFIELPANYPRQSVMMKHGTKMDGRTVDITPSDPEEMRVFLEAIANPPAPTPAPAGTDPTQRDQLSPYTLWLRGMPFTCTEADVHNFFFGLNIKRRGVSLIQDYYGELTGEAVVQFETAGDLAAAKLREGRFMQNRFVEWQKHPSCNVERLGRIFNNEDPTMRLEWDGYNHPPQAPPSYGPPSTHPDPYAAHEGAYDAYSHPPHQGGQAPPYAPYPPQGPYHQYPYPPQAYPQYSYDAYSHPHHGGQQAPPYWGQGYPSAEYGYYDQGYDQGYSHSYGPHGYQPHPPHYAPYQHNPYGYAPEYGQPPQGYWQEGQQSEEGGNAASLELESTESAEKVSNDGTANSGDSNDVVSGPSSQSLNRQESSGTPEGEDSVADGAKTAQSDQPTAGLKATINTAPHDPQSPPTTFAAAARRNNNNSTRRVPQRS